MDKINILKNIIPYTALLLRHIHRHNVIHTRCPSFQVLSLSLYLGFSPKRFFGINMQEIGVVEISPLFYRLQRLLLNISIPSPSFVSINGNTNWV